MIIIGRVEECMEFVESIYVNICRMQVACGQIKYPIFFLNLIFNLIFVNNDNNLKDKVYFISKYFAKLFLSLREKIWILSSREI